jgi:WD40 repeat protein
MLRWLSFFAAVALVAIGVVFYIYGGPPRTLIEPPHSGVPADQAPAAEHGKQALAGQAPPAAAPQGPWTRDTAVTPRVVIPGARLTPLHSPRVPSMIDGQVLFLGTELKLKPSEKRPDNAFSHKMSYLVTEVQPDEKEPRDDWVPLDGRMYRPLTKDDPIVPGRIRLCRTEKWFVPVDEGTQVKKDALLAVIDPVTAVDDLAIKVAKFEAAEADRLAEAKQRDEYRERWQRADLLWKRGAGSLEDATAAKLAYDYHVYETKHKEEDLKVAASEMRQSETILDLHMVRSKINGEVKQLNKHQGESIEKIREPLLEMQDHSKLRIKGRIDLQDLYSLPDPRDATDARPVYVEATRLVAPKQILTGHFDVVTGVAVSRDGQIVSVSNDRTGRVWEKDSARPKERLVLKAHRTALRAVACSPASRDDVNLCLTGGADGVGRLYDLSPGAVDAPVRQLTGGHKEAINSVAFSPDGRWAVTGGDDRAICLWDVDSGSLLQTFPEGHQGNVTWVAFLAVGSEDNRRLSVVSAGRDNAVMVWPLTAGGAPESPIRLDRRGGEVLTLGVNSHGNQLLFDQGKELRVLSSENAALVGSLSSTTGNSFSRLALFSPDGRLILTSTGPGRLGLWRAPTDQTRGHEFEQLVWTSNRDDQATTTCGAFDPKSSFLVTGTQNRNVIVWPMPSKEDVERQLTAKIISREAEVSAGQVRVTAELDNPGYLLPGDAVTLVVYPEKK